MSDEPKIEKFQQAEINYMTGWVQVTSEPRHRWRKDYPNGDMGYIMQELGPNGEFLWDYCDSAHQPIRNEYAGTLELAKHECDKLASTFEGNS